MSETESAAVAAPPDPAAAAERKPRRLRGHKKGAVTCCVASSARPGVVASSGEDGCLCWFDLRTKDVLLTMEAANKPISSICFKPGNEDCVYISAGNEILSFDVRMGTQSKPLEMYNYNRDEINQIAVSSKGFLAAADDSGDVKIVNTIQKCLYKRLREAHTSICSSVQFIPWRPWTAITGGLDSKLAAWDFSKGRTLFSIDYGSPELQNGSSSGSAGQCFNPAFVHSVAVSEEGILGGLYKKVYYHSGGLRLNPNLYESGKVCLSLLNAWWGNGCEKWGKSNSTMLQVLVSIQGLVLNDKPYFNEPGNKNSAQTTAGEKYSLAYNQTAFVRSCKTMLYSLRKPPKHFETLVMFHFHEHERAILDACSAYMSGTIVGSSVGSDLKYARDKCFADFHKSLTLYTEHLRTEFAANRRRMLELEREASPVQEFICQNKHC